MNPLLGMNPLHPFDTTRAWPFDVQARCRLVRTGVIGLDFLLKGDARTIEIPKFDKKYAERTDGLWHSTCFEAFIALPDQAPYIEINLSPSGDWNIYSFKNYRKADAIAQPMGEVRAQILPRTKTEVLMQAEVEVHELSWLEGALDIKAKSELIVGLSAVIELRNQDKAYCALTHKADKPDFHNRESFIGRMLKI